MGRGGPKGRRIQKDAAFFSDEESEGQDISRTALPEQVRKHKLYQEREQNLRKMILLAVVLALAASMMAAAPAMADDNDHHDFFDGFFNGFEPTPALSFDQEIGNTGDVNLSTNVSQTGNNSNQCVAPLQFGNTGNLQNAQGFATFGTPFFNDNNDNNGFFRHRFFPFFNNGFNDVNFEGSTFEFTPTLTNTCNQSVEQAAAAGN